MYGNNMKAYLAKRNEAKTEAVRDIAGFLALGLAFVIFYSLVTVAFN